MIQAGIFGFGPNNKLNQWTGRDDFSIQPVWQFQNLGFGNLAMIKRQRGPAVAGHHRAVPGAGRGGGGRDPGPGRVQSAALRVVQADRSLRTGLITFNGTFEGLKEISRFGNVLVLITRPQEAVYALQLLQRGLRGVLHHGGRVQPGAVRAVPRPGLSRAGGHARAPAGRGPAGGPGAADLPAPGGQRAAPGHPMNAGRPGRPARRPRSRRAIREGSRDSNDGTARLAIDVDRGLAARLGRARAVRGPAPGPRDGVDGPPAPPAAGRRSLPSTVSPVIERFMSRKVRSLPQPPARRPPRRRRADGRDHPHACRRRWPRRSPVPGERRPSGSCRRPLADVPPPRRRGASTASTTPPSPLATQVKLGPAPFEPPDLRFPINLATALRLSDARPLIVAAAQASVWVAEADLQQARVLWIPDAQLRRRLSSGTTAAAPTSTRAS